MYYFLSIATLAGINIIVVLGVTILTGFTGMFSMGQAGFMAVGAYTAASLYMYLGVPYIIAVIIGGVVAALSSLIVGIPTIRNKLSGDCFAIAMLGFGEAVRLLISNTKPIFNGALGIVGIPKKTSILVIVCFVVATIYLVKNYLASHYGKNCVAVQQQEIAAEMMGVDVASTKIWSLVLSAFFAGIGGGLYAFFMTGIYPTNFAQTKSTDIAAAVVFGGTNSVTGPVIAAIILVMAPEMLRVFSRWRLVLYGLLFVIMMLFKPEGLFGYKEISVKRAIGFCKNLAKRVIGFCKNKFIHDAKSDGEQNV